MSRRFHVNPATGDYGPCHAVQGKCPFGGVDGNDNHYATAGEAQAASEAWHESHSEHSTLKKVDILAGFVPVQEYIPDEEYEDEAERISKLSKDREQYATGLDVEGKLDHTKALIWDENASLDNKITFLAFYHGKQWREAHSPEEFEERLAEAVNDYYGVMSTPLNSFNEEDMYHRRAEASEQVELYTDNQDDLPRLAKSVLKSNGSGNRVDAIVHRTDADGNKLPDVIVTSGVRYGQRSILAKNACRAVMYPASCKSKTGMVRLTTKMFTTRGFGSTQRQRLYQVDADALIGWSQIRKTLKDTKGVDIREFNYDSDENIRTIYDGIDELAAMEANVHRQAAYDKETRTGKIADAFTDKVETSRQCEEAAKDTRLHQVFDHIEFDEDMDLKKLPQMEGEIIAAMNHLPKTSKPIGALRVRKLGKYRGNTSGVYSPVHNAIALDDGKATRNGYSGMAAFIHEYAHHIDYTMKDGSNVSTSDEFRPVLDAVNANINRQDGLDKNHKEYLKTPTEVFSRCFEWWAVKKLGVKSSLAKTEEEYDSGSNYAAFKGNEELIDNVMSKLFPDMKGFNTLDKSGWYE